MNQHYQKYKEQMKATSKKRNDMINLYPDAILKRREMGRIYYHNRQAKKSQDLIGNERDIEIKTAKDHSKVLLSEIELEGWISTLNAFKLIDLYVTIYGHEVSGSSEQQIAKMLKKLKETDKMTIEEIKGVTGEDNKNKLYQKKYKEENKGKLSDDRKRYNDKKKVEFKAMKEEIERLREENKMLRNG